MRESYDKLLQENNTFTRDSSGYRPGGYREPSPIPATKDQMNSAMQKLLE